jgi:hypothetical protein
MTKIDILDIAGGSGMLLQCPHCNTYNLDTPLLPRGDDHVECLTCGRLFTYARAESHALASTRQMLARKFPNLPLDPL